LIVIITGILFLRFAYRLSWNHRERLWCEYFGKDRESPKDSWKTFWRQWGELAENHRASFSWSNIKTLLPRIAKSLYQAWKNRETPAGWFVDVWDEAWERQFDPRARTPIPPQRRSALRIGGWNPPLVEDKSIDPGRLSIDAESLFKAYLLLSLLPVRICRGVAKIVLYFMLAYMVSSLLKDPPTLLLIRGPYSHCFDFLFLMAALFVCLFVLFYVLDSARVTAKLLDFISRHPTRWPRKLLQEKSDSMGVEAKHLDGWLDVDFTAVQTKEFGRIMFGPITIIFLLIASRWSYFDAWTWTPSLIAIFGMNLLLATFCWAVVRQSARAVRDSALTKLEEAIRRVANSEVSEYGVPTPEGAVALLPKRDYVRRLIALQEKVKGESRGAYARWFQDPSYLGLFIPTGISGILAAIAQFWLNK
jgi:hypothetical protein